MKKANIQDIELGNLLFGNSRGEYAIDRSVYSQMFHDFLDKNGFDEYGYRDNKPEFENSVFIIRPYYWGDDETQAEKPNFEYKPEDIQISWYKYPLRDAYCNKDVSPEHMQEILDACTKSLLDQQA